MNSIATSNVVVFELEIEGQLDKRVGEAPTRTDDCLRQVWMKLAAQEPLPASSVRRVYSEWEPTQSDHAFITATFPPSCEVTYSFPRPETEAGWDDAIREVEEQLRQAAAKRAAEEALDQPNNQLDDLLPVLRSGEPSDAFAENIVHEFLAPGLGIFLAHVSFTTRKTIGTRYMMQKDLSAIGRPPHELLAIACHNLASQLKIEAVALGGERVFVVKHPLDMGASAIALPDLHANASQWAESPDLVVGFPDPSVLILTASTNLKAVARIREAVVTSDYMDAVALTPACYKLTAAGLELIVARPNPSPPQA